MTLLGPDVAPTTDDVATILVSLMVGNRKSTKLAQYSYHGS